MNNKNEKFRLVIGMLALLFIASSFGQGDIDKWKEVGFDDSGWDDVQALGPVGTAPWGALTATGLASGLSSNAQWIWEPGGNPTSSVPAGDWYFRKTFAIPAGKTVQSAELIMSADNTFTAHLNGTQIGSDTEWETFNVYSVQTNLFSTSNVLAVEAKNTATSPSGLIGSLILTFTDNTTLDIYTGTGWKVIKVIVPISLECNESDLTGIRGPVPYGPRLLQPPAHDLPGDPKPVPVHKGVDLEVWHQPGDNFHVGGLAVLDNGELLELDYDGKLYHVTGLEKAETVTRRELPGTSHPNALGLLLRNNRDVYILDLNSVWTYDFDGQNLTQETKLLDIPKRSSWYGWNTDISADDTYIYFGLGTRGGFSRYHMANKTWEHDFAIAMRNSNGMGMADNGDIWFSDNQGNYRPASPIFLMKQGKSYGIPTNNWADGAAKWQSVLGPAPDLEPYKDDMIWLIYPEMSFSSTDIHFMKSGPFKGQPLVGDNRTGHLNRLMIEEVDGQKQGTAIRLTGGLEAGTYRIIEDGKGTYYLGGLGTPGNVYWAWCNKAYGFQKMTFKQDFIGNANFNDVLNVSLVKNGVVVEFTSDISADYLSSSNYRTYVFNYITSVTPYYGGAKKDSTGVNILSIEKLSNRHIFLNVEGLIKESILAVEFGNKLTVDNNLESFEMYYTMNHLSTRVTSDIVTGVESRRFFHEISVNQKGNFIYIHGLKGNTTNHTIYNVMGRAIHNLEFKNISHSGSVDISSLTNGVYFLKMKINNQPFTKTFVIR